MSTDYTTGACCHLPGQSLPGFCLGFRAAMQVEQKIVEELRQHDLLATQQQPQPRGPDYADLDKLTYLSCVIKEAMRVHTVSSMTYSGRQAK